MIVVLLGPQRFKPTLAQSLADHGVNGRVATITAGWQEREPDDAELHAELDGRSVNLRLHARGEEVFADDPELKEAHRVRQDRMQILQDTYRLRLDFAMEAARAAARRAPDAELLVEEWQLSLEQLRTLDRRHLDRMRAAHVDFEARHSVGERPAVARQRNELAALIDDCSAVVIAGGHVAVLLNRLKLFDVASLLGDRPVFAWSAGAMALAEKVVLFHDAPPQGAGVAQVLDEGLALAPGIVPLPSPRQRLRLDDREQVSLFARRFAPAACAALDDGAQVTFDGERWTRAEAMLRLDAAGSIDTGWPS